MPMLSLQQLCNSDTPPPHKRKRSDTDASSSARVRLLDASPHRPKLPAKVLELIWAYCDTLTLKQVRLCCSLWARDIGMFLFDHVTLLPHIYFNTRFVAAFGSSDVRYHIHKVLVDGWWRGPILGVARPISLALGDEWADLRLGKTDAFYAQIADERNLPRQKNGLRGALDVLPSLSAVTVQAGGYRCFTSYRNTKPVVNGITATPQAFQEELLEKVRIPDLDTHVHLDFLHMRHKIPQSGSLMRGSVANVPQFRTVLVRKEPSPIFSYQIIGGAGMESNITLPSITMGAIEGS